MREKNTDTAGGRRVGKMDGRKVFVVAIILILLPEKSATGKLFNFLNATCAARYRCPDVPGLICTLEHYNAGCPFSVQDSPDLIPSDPREYSVNKTTVERDRGCASGFSVNWMAPYDAGGLVVQGFEIRVTGMGGLHSGKEDCVRILTTGTKWTQQLLESKIHFTYDCFMPVPLGIYNIRLESLPKTKFQQTPSEDVDRQVTINGLECKSHSPGPPKGPEDQPGGPDHGSDQPGGPDHGSDQPEDPGPLDESNDNSNKEISLPLEVIAGVISGILLLLISITILILGWKRFKPGNHGDMRPNNEGQRTLTNEEYLPDFGDPYSIPSDVPAFHPPEAYRAGGLEPRPGYDQKTIIVPETQTVCTHAAGVHDAHGTGVQTSDLGPSLETDEIDVMTSMGPGPLPGGKWPDSISGYIYDA